MTPCSECGQTDCPMTVPRRHEQTPDRRCLSDCGLCEAQRVCDRTAAIAQPLVDEIARLQAELVEARKARWVRCTRATVSGHDFWLWELHPPFWVQMRRWRR